MSGPQRPLQITQIVHVLLRIDFVFGNTMPILEDALHVDNVQFGNKNGGRELGHNGLVSTEEKGIANA